MDDAITKNLENLVRRLEAIEAERDILGTLYRYSHCLDYGLEAEWVDCFSNDAIFEVTGPAILEMKLQGRAALADFAANHTRAPEHYHKHLVMDPVITLGKGEATSVSYFVRLDAMTKGPGIRAFGRYYDQLIKGSDGKWRFKYRRAEVEAFFQESKNTYRSHQVLQRFVSQ